MTPRLFVVAFCSVFLLGGCGPDPRIAKQQAQIDDLKKSLVSTKLQIAEIETALAESCSNFNSRMLKQELDTSREFVHVFDYDASAYDVEMLSNHVSWLEDQVRDEEKTASERDIEVTKELTRLWEAK